MTLFSEVTPTPTPTPTPVETIAPVVQDPNFVQLVGIIPEQWQIVAVALALIVFTAGVLLAVKI